MVWPLSRDKRAGSRWVEIDPGIQDLVPGFLDNRRKDLMKIREALRSGDFETLKVLGHWMKGAGAGYGFEEITVIGQALEKAAKEGNTKAVKEESARLEKYLKNLHWKPVHKSEEAPEASAAGSEKSFELLKFINLAIFLGCLLLTFITWQYARNNVRQQKQIKFYDLTQRIQSGIQQKTDLYINALHGVEAFFAASTSVERDEWKTFAQKSRLSSRFPSAKALVFIERVPLEAKGVFEESIRSDKSLDPRGFPHFKIYPEAEKSEYFVVKYAKSLHGGKDLVGMDLGTDPDLLKAFYLSMNHGTPSMSGMKLGEDKGEALRMLFVPVYRHNTLTQDEQERRADFMGFAGFIFNVDLMLQQIVSKNEIFKDIDIEIFDGAKVSSENLFYDSGKEMVEAVEALNDDYLKLEAVIPIVDQSWTVHFSTKMSVGIDRIRKYFPTAVLIAGVIFSFLLFGFLHLLRTSRERAMNLARKMTKDLRGEIVERKKAEAQLQEARDQALEASRAKSEFLATMSHEIRTPMNAILGMADLLVDEMPPEERSELLKILKRSGENLLQLINDILDLSKAESGKAELEEADFLIRDKISRLLEMLITQAKMKDLDLSYEVAEDVPGMVRGDSQRLGQILLNLLTNAIKFTERGSVSVHVKSQDLPDSGGRKRCRLLFSVRDTGIGIAPENIEKIFRPFTQADSSTTRKYGGTGLGLSISKKLVEIMHGNIGVESQPGVGTTFYFSVELGIPEAPAQAQPVARNPEAAEKREAFDIKTPFRLLVAEDSEDNRALLQHYLKKTACLLDFAENGAAAFQKVTLTHYDLVLMDMHMPVMDGYKAVRAIRDWESTRPLSGPRLAIVAVTADASKEAEKRSLEAGCDSFLVKPVQKSMLLDEISKYLGIVKQDSGKRAA